MNLPTKNLIVSKLSKYKGEKKVILYDQRANDIINELCKNHNINKSEYDKISRYFYHDDLVLTAKHLFDFCKKNINYVIERGTDQTLRSPGAILINGKGDCKQYSQFIGGILDSIDRLYKPVNWVYRFSAYNGNVEVQHVFVVMKYNNIEYWIDPVLNYFNEKKEYNFKKDKRMSLYQVSGIENDDDQIGFSLRLNDISLNNIKNFVVKVATFPARQAFLAIVSINAFNLGKAIAKGILKDRNKIKKFWENTGGDFNALLRAVNNKQSEFKVSGNIGIEPVTTTAAVVASPIIIAITQVLKEIGIDPKNLGESVKNIVINKTAEVIKNEGKIFVENGIKHVVQLVDKKPVLIITKATEQEVKVNKEDNGNTIVEPIKKDNTLLYAGGAALALYLITKK